MWELDHKEGWVPKNWCFWTVVLEKTLESSLDSKRIKPVNPKGNQFSSVQLLSCVWLFATPWTATCHTYLSITNSQSLLKLMSLAWIFIGRTDAEAPILWPPDVKSQLIGKDPDVGKDWGQEKKGDNTGWDGWMALLTQWTWVWANSRR